MAHNHKYGAVTTERGNIAPGEPIFILRARDPLATEAALYYLSLRVEYGAPPEIAEDISAAIDEMSLWKQEHGTKPADTGS